MAGEEFLIGQNFSRDGSDYDRAAATPRWDELFDVALEELMSEFEMVVLGILYPGGKPDAFSFITDWKSLVNAANPGGTRVGTHAKLQTVLEDEIDSNREARNPDNTLDFLQNLHPMKQTPEHIYGFVLRKIR